MNILREEFIGREFKIILSSSRGFLNFKGVVLNETKNTFLALSLDGKKTLPKKGNVFLFKDLGEVVGDKIILRPQDRIKL